MPVNKEHAAQKKGEQNIAGIVKQTELYQKLPAGKTTAKEFPPEAGNAQLDQIHVHRQRGEDHVTTQYPNGVKYKKSDTYKTHSNDIHTVSSHQVKIQKAGSEVAIEIEPPPGGRVSAGKDGRTIISDAKGNNVATVDKDGTLHTHSKEGEYTQKPDGKIRFEQKQKGNLESSRKAGPINPSDYENYGITTGGGKIRFPNGVEWSRAPETIGEERRRLDRGANPGIQVRIPDGRVVFEQVGKARWEEITGTSADGEIVATGNVDALTVRTPGGDFTVRQDGQISYRPSKQ